MSYEDLTSTEARALRTLLRIEPVSVGTVHEVPGLIGTGGAVDHTVEGSPVVVTFRDERAEGGITVAEIEGWEIRGSLSEIREAAGGLLAIHAGDAAPGEFDPAVCLEILAAAGLAVHHRAINASACDEARAWRVDDSGRLLARVRMIRAGRAGWRAVSWRCIATVSRMRHDGSTRTTWSLNAWEDLPKAFDAPLSALDALMREHARHLLEPIGAAAIIERHEAGAASSAAHEAKRELERAGYRAFQAMPHELTRSEHRASDRDMTRRAVAVLLEDAEIRAAVLEALDIDELIGAYDAKIGAQR